MQSTFHEHTLPNGLRIVCEVMPRVRSAAFGFLVNTGSRHEGPDEHGVSHFLEHMCFKGNERRDWRDINVGFDELGSIYNAFTGKEHTVYYGWVPAERGAEQLDLLSDLLRPKLAPDDFETERKVILEEIAMSADSFEHHVWNHLHQHVFGAHPLAHEILGEKESIERLPRETMVAYHARRYAADNVTLVAAGAVEPEDVYATCARVCGAWQRSGNGAARTEPPRLALRGAHALKLEQFKQQAVVLLYPSVPAGHRLTETIETFSAIFGGQNSRCFWNIVQKGICSQAGAAWLSYRDCGVLALYADGEPQRCEEMIEALRREAQHISSEGVTVEEVERVRNQRRTHLALEAESPRTRLMQLVDDVETHGAPRSAAARRAAVERVTADDVAAYLRDYPITGEGMLLSCGPRQWP